MSEKNESTLFRKKPVVVQAVQYPCEHPALRRCDCDGNSACSSCGLEYIETLEGCMNVSPGDWIITGVRGEHYPCKPDIFAATYEPAYSPAPSAPGDAQDERQAFEAWFTRNDETKDMAERAVRRSPSGAYVLMQTYTAWEIWQAARSRAPAAGDALDAKRYRWLRDPQSDPALVLDKRTGYVPEDESVRGVGGYYTYEYRAGEELDAAIDAALAAQVPQQGEA